MASGEYSAGFGVEQILRQWCMISPLLMSCSKKEYRRGGGGAPAKVTTTCGACSTLTILVLRCGRRQTAETYGDTRGRNGDITHGQAVYGCTENADHGRGPEICSISEFVFVEGTLSR